MRGLSRPLAILHVAACPFPTHQGSQVYVRGLVEALARKGHRVALACYAHGTGRIEAPIDLVRTPRVPGGAFTSSGPHWSRPVQDLLLARAVARQLRRRRFDLVHAHNVEGPLVAWAACRQAGVPLVYGQHTAMVEELPTYVRGPHARGAARALGGSLDLAMPRLADAAVALSPRGAEGLRARGAREVALVPPGIDLRELEGADADRARARWRLEGRPWVVYTGNADAYQDLPVLFAAMARVPEAGLLVVTGDDTAPWEELADVLGIGPERRRLVRSALFADARDAIAASTVAALPRTRCAGFPIKLLNLLGLGAPVVAAEGGVEAMPGVLRVRDGDPEAFAGAIRRLLSRPDERRALAEAGRAGVEETFGWDSVADRLVALYRRLVAPGVTPGGGSSLRGVHGPPPRGGEQRLPIGPS